MKKYYWTLMPLLMALFVCVGLASCSSDDDDKPSGGSYNTEKLIGTWEFSTGTETVMGQVITIDRSMLSQMESQIEQASGTNVEFWDVTLHFTENTINGAPYTLNGNQIVMDGMKTEGLSVTVTVKSVTDTTLILHEVITIDGLTITADMTYKKV